jgi:prolipoprotein diacylglyceryl transferase
MLFDSTWTGDVPRIAFTVFNKEIAWYGILVTLGMIVGLVLGIIRAKKIGITSDDVLELFLIAVPLAVIAARIGYVVFRPDEFFVKNFGWDDFVNIIAIWDGGLTIMTALLGGLAGGLIWAKWRKADFIHITDRILPVVLVSQAIGRWGNFFNQEIYGMQITNPHAQWFPLAVFISDRGAYFQACFFYEGVFNLIMFGLVVFVLSRLRVKGAGTILYISGYTLIRFVMEFLRDDLGFYTGVNYNQIICIIISVLGYALLAFLIIRKTKKGEKVWYKGGIPDELFPLAKAKSKA